MNHPQRSRLRGRFFTTLSALSLLLCVAATLALLLGLKGGVSVTIGDTDFWSADGKVGFNNLPALLAESKALSEEAGDLTRVLKNCLEDARLAEKYESEAFSDPPARARLRPSPVEFEQRSIDCVDVIIASSLLPIVWVYRKRSEKRLIPLRNYCVVCGYDLRASPEFCPECGTPRDEVIGMQSTTA